MHNKTVVLVLLTIALLTSACSPIQTLNALIPADGYQLSSGLAYGELKRQKLDVYVPRHAQVGMAKLPVVVFFYGGSWESGQRQDYKFIGEALSSSGFVVIIPDYRVYPEVVFPDFLYDAAKAVQWARTHAPSFGGDAARLFVAGHSAGAHIAAMLSLDKRYLASVAMQPNDLAGMIGLAGPYDFLPLKTKKLNTIFGPVDQQYQSQPIHFVNGDAPPMLLMVGKADGTVWPRNSYRLADKLAKAGGSVKLIEFENYGHIDMVAKLAKPLRGDSTLLQDMVKFIQQRLPAESSGLKHQ